MGRVNVRSEFLEALVEEAWERHLKGCDKDRLIDKLLDLLTDTKKPLPCVAFADSDEWERCELICCVAEPKKDCWLRYAQLLIRREDNA